MIGHMIGMAAMIPWIVEETKRNQEEEFAFQKHCSTLPYEEAQALRDKRGDTYEKRRKELQDERRHQELCNAIKSTSFWRF